MRNTTKADKYIRLMANLVKLIRTATPETKEKYSKLYKNILILRQIFRWQGLYEAIIEINEKGWGMLEMKNLPNLVWIMLEMFGDTLDRFVFVIELFKFKDSESTCSQLEQLESNIYFIQCFTWLLFHIRTCQETFKNGDKKKKRIKVLKIIKYLFDSLTSYCKFSKRIWELEPKKAAILGILSSLIGLYEIFV